MTSILRLLAFLSTALVGAASQAMAGPTVYFPLGSVPEILIIDAEHDRVVGSISGVEDAHGLAGSLGGEHLVAGMYAETAAGEPVSPPKPEGMSEEEHEAHHAAQTGATAVPAACCVSFVSVISPSERRVTRRIEVPGAVHHPAVTPDGRYAVATHPGRDGISVIDLSTLRVLDFVHTGSLPDYAIVGPDGKRIYVSNSGNDTISEVDTERWVVRRNIVVGEGPSHMVLSPDGRTLYVNNVEGGTVSAVSLDEGEVAETYFIGGELHGIDLSDDGRTLFVAGRGEDKLVAIDLVEGSTRSMPLAPAPYHLAALPGTGKLYLSSAEEPKIWVVDQRSLEVRNEIPIGGGIGHQMVVLER